MDGDSIHFLDGGGEMAAAIASTDWSATPLGLLSEWPGSLKVAVSMMLNSAFPMALCWGDELITLYNDAFVPVLGAKHPCQGRPFLTIWDEARDSIAPIAEAALAGRSTFIEDYPLVVNRNGTAEQANFTFCYSPLRDENGHVRGMLDTVIETTAKVRGEHLTRLRNRELVHRSQNTLAVLSAVIGQSFRSAGSLDEAQEKIQRRLTTLSRAQDVLTDAVAPEADLEQVIRHALAPFESDTGQIAISGPPTRIDGARATILSLALHELCTNASKYGALSAGGGLVDLRWTIDAPDGAAPVLTLDWVESGGPPALRPERTGFGTFLVMRAMPQEFGGEVTVDYLPEGLHMRLTAPLPGILPAPTAHPA